jgi:hypothetical protein
VKNSQYSIIHHTRNVRGKVEVTVGHPAHSYSSPTSTHHLDGAVLMPRKATGPLTPRTKLRDSPNAHASTHAFSKAGTNTGRRK